MTVERTFSKDGNYVWCDHPCSGPLGDNLDCCFGPYKDMESSHDSGQFPKCTAINSPKNGITISLQMNTNGSNFHELERYAYICRYYCNALGIEEI